MVSIICSNETRKYKDITQLKALSHSAVQNVRSRCLCSQHIYPSYMQLCHCISGMHRILICSCMFFQFISVSCYPPSDTAGTNAHTHNSHCTSALLTSQTIQSIYTNKHMSLTATHSHSTLQQPHAPNWCSLQQSADS